MSLQKNESGTKKTSSINNENDVNHGENQEQLIQIFKEELACPICKDLFENPQVLQCGHSFCYKCLKCWLAHSISSSFNEDRENEEEEKEKQKIAGCPVCGFKIIRFPVFNQTVSSLVDRFEQVYVKQYVNTELKMDDKRTAKKRKLEEYKIYESYNSDDRPMVLFKKSKKMYPELYPYESNRATILKTQRDYLHSYSNSSDFNFTNDSDSMICRICGWEISNERGQQTVAGRQNIDFCIPCARMLWFKERAEEKVVESSENSTSEGEDSDEYYQSDEAEDRSEEEEEQECQFNLSDSGNGNADSEDFEESESEPYTGLDENED